MPALDEPGRYLPKAESSPDASNRRLTKILVHADGPVAANVSQFRPSGTVVTPRPGGPFPVVRGVTWLHF
jgi:hypothetical protein